MTVCLRVKKKLNLKFLALKGVDSAAGMEHVGPHRVRRLLFELYGRHPSETTEWSQISRSGEKSRNAFLDSLSFNNENNKSLCVANVREGGLRDTKNPDKEVRFCGNSPDIEMRFKGEWNLSDQLDILATFRNTMNSILKQYPDAECRGRLFIE